MRIHLLSVLVFLGFAVSAQNVGINNTGASPNASALLDVDAAPTNDKGILIPRVPLTQTSSNAPIGGGVATSLMVYNTATANDVTPGYYYWDGTKWVRILGSNNAWLLLGNAGTTAGTNFLGTTDAQSLVFKTNNTEWMRLLTTGNLGVGTATPVEKIHAVGPNAGIMAEDNTFPGNVALLQASSTFAGPSIVAHTNTSNQATFNTIANRIEFGNSGIIFRNSPATTVGTARVFTERMRITNAGDVGINTTTPQSKLQINADVNIGREWGDVLQICQAAVDNGEVFDVADGGAGTFSMVNGNFLTNFQCGGHRYLVGYIDLPAGKYQITLQTRGLPVYTNCNGGGNGPNSMRVGVWLVAGGTLVTDPTVCFADGPSPLNTSRITYTTNGAIATVAAGTYGIWIVPNQFLGDYQTLLMSAKIWRLE